MNEWKYNHPLDPQKLSMHDCKVTQMEWKPINDGYRMVWYFSDGIWLIPDIECCEITQICRTAEAQVIFAGKSLVYESELAAAVCVKQRWHGRGKHLNTETWENMPLNEFIDRFHDGGWSLEIIDTYTEGRKFLITGEIHTPKEGWWRSFRLSFIAATADYYWNAIRPDRVW